MFLSLKDLNTTEISYPGSPSVEEQMMLFHTGPLNLVTENIETVKEAGHKQQDIEARVMPLTSKGCLDPEEGCQPHAMGDMSGAASSSSSRVGHRVLGFGAMTAVLGAGAGWFMSSGDPKKGAIVGAVAGGLAGLLVGKLIGGAEGTIEAVSAANKPQSVT